MTVVALAMGGSLVACKDKAKPDGDTAAAPKPTVTDPGAAAPKPSEVALTPTLTQAPVPIETAAVMQAALDVCALATRGQVETVLGALQVDPIKQNAAASLLGGCSYAVAEGAAIVSARPTSEWDATVTAMGGTEVPGLGEAASQGKGGLFVKVAGKPYFLHIVTPATTGASADQALALAKVFLGADPTAKIR